MGHTAFAPVNSGERSASRYFVMPTRTPLGQYRHTPADQIQIGPDGHRYHTHARRRMPFAAQVFVAYAALGPLLALATALLLKQIDGGRLLPDVIAATKLPPCPSPQNVLFGAGWTEIVLGCGVAGWALWTKMWRTRFSLEDAAAGPRALVPRLVKQGIAWSLILTPITGLLATVSLYIRTAPPEQPWIVRPFFALLAAVPMGIGAFWTGIIPLVMLLLGVLVGAASGIVASLVFPHYPEEPITR